VQIKKILLIDDNPNIRTVAQIGLEDVGGWQVLLAASGPEGLSLAASDLPDAILLDVMMPGMDGPTTLSKLREVPALAKIPVIFLTAKAQKEEVAHYLSLGALGVITKPFDPLTLPKEIMALVGKDNN
jgi:CheY-like chemotaxis protein